MALDLIAELQRLIVAFDRGGVEYALCGGLAVAVHGHPRATMDIDVLVRAEQVPAAMVFGRRSKTPREVQRLSKLDPETNTMTSVDMIIVGETLEAVSQGRDVWIVSREGLIAMKRLAGRPQDVADIAVLEGGSDDDQRRAR